jgi:hypothetical protein
MTNNLLSTESLTDDEKTLVNLRAEQIIEDFNDEQLDSLIFKLEVGLKERVFARLAAEDSMFLDDDGLVGDEDQNLGKL